MGIAFEIIAREVIAFFEAKSTLALVAMIALDLITGVIAALRTSRFDLQRLADFYRTSVIPYVIGYGALYVFTGIGLDQYLAPGFVDMLQPFTSSFALASLAGSIADNVQRARYTPAPPHDGDMPSSNTLSPPLG